MGQQLVNNNQQYNKRLEGQEQEQGYLTIQPMDNKKKNGDKMVKGKRVR